MTESCNRPVSVQELPVHLLVIDYYSRFIEIAKLTSTTSQAIVSHLKSIFSRYGIPERLISDNGPQYASAEFADFARKYGFDHITSSPYYPQANGEAERAVATVKRILEKSEDPYLAMLSYRTTPLQHGYSPAELLMSRKLRTTLPGVKTEMRPKVPDWTTLKYKDEEIKDRQTRDFNNHHGTRELPPLTTGEKVWVADQKIEGTVSGEKEERSYEITTPKGKVRRNRRHLVVMTENTNKPGPTEPAQQSIEATPTNIPSSKVTTRSGREVKVPEGYKD